MGTKKNIFLGAIISVCLFAGCTSGNTAYLEKEVKIGEETEIDENTDTEISVSSETQEGIYIYVYGAVRVPGIYMVQPGSRVFEVIDLAGGFTEDACEESVNQAEVLTDAQMIRILTEEEYASKAETEEVMDVDDGKVNLNTAALADLMTLPGVGKAKAEAIIAYREAQGGFTSIEEIMNIDGIKEGVFNQIKDSIKVN